MFYDNFHLIIQNIGITFLYKKKGLYKYFYDNLGNLSEQVVGKTAQ